MIREEAKKYFDRLYEGGFCKEDLMIGLDKIYDKHEAEIERVYLHCDQLVAQHKISCEAYETQLKDKEERIKKLEAPKTCDGCENNNNGMCDNKYICIRQLLPTVHDRFKQKDNDATKTMPKM